MYVLFTLSLCSTDSECCRSMRFFYNSRCSLLLNSIEQKQTMSATSFKMAGAKNNNPVEYKSIFDAPLRLASSLPGGPETIFPVQGNENIRFQEVEG